MRHLPNTTDSLHSLTLSAIFIIIFIIITITTIRRQNNEGDWSRLD